MRKILFLSFLAFTLLEIQIVFADDGNNLQKTSTSSEKPQSTVNTKGVITPAPGALENAKPVGNNSGGASILNPSLFTIDTDRDGSPDVRDNCLNVSNADQRDTDRDGIGDTCDNCAGMSNRDQADFNVNGMGDACEDTDSDNIFDAIDNCPTVANIDQRDSSRPPNGIGDACDNVDCPEPEFTINFDIQRCTYYRADPCGDFNEGTCVNAPANTPVTSFHPNTVFGSPWDGYGIRWTSRNATQLQDSCGNLLGDRSSSVSYGSAGSGRYFASMTPRTSSEGPYSRISVNPAGESRYVEFRWGSNGLIPRFETRREDHVDPGLHNWTIPAFVPYHDTFVSFEENTTRMASSSISDDFQSGFVSQKTGTLNCTVRATNACGRTTDFHYRYSCMP